MGIKIRAKNKKGVTLVKCLMSHPMEPGNRKDKKTGKMVKPHFIEEVTCEHNGNVVMSCYWGGGVSKNPYLSYKFKGGKSGDSIRIHWQDNQGKTDAKEIKIK